MILNKELINYNNKLYWVYRKIKNNQIKEGKVNDVKDFWGCDVVLKMRSDSEDLIFLREITDLELVN
jgi:hypothetical protein